MPDIVMSDEFDRRFARKPPVEQGQILKAIKFLKDNPRHPGLQAKRIKSHPIAWEARTDRANRLSFHFGADGVIYLRTNCNHNEVLKRP